MTRSRSKMTTTQSTGTIDLLSEHSGVGPGASHLRGLDEQDACARTPDRLACGPRWAARKRRAREAPGGSGHCAHQSVRVGRFHRERRIGPTLATHADPIPSTARRARSGLAEMIPESVVGGIAAGLHVAIRFPEDDDEEAIVEEVRRRQVVVSSIGQFCMGVRRGPPRSCSDTLRPRRAPSDLA
jgi:hypothetical protein